MKFLDIVIDEEQLERVKQNHLYPVTEDYNGAGQTLTVQSPDETPTASDNSTLPTTAIVCVILLLLAISLIVATQVRKKKA